MSATADRAAVRRVLSAAGAVLLLDHHAGRARRRSRRPANAWPSNRSPRIATNRSPGSSGRESIDQRSTRTAPSPDPRGPPCDGGRDLRRPVSVQSASTRYDTRDALRAARQRRPRDRHVVERQRPVANDLLISRVPCPRSRTRSPRSRVADRLLDRRRADRRWRTTACALSFRRTRSAGVTMPRRISSMIAAGSSLRGLSDVHDHDDRSAAPRRRPSAAASCGRDRRRSRTP